MTKYINFQQLQKKLGNRSRSAIYVDMKTDRLPKPVKIGRRLYWSEETIDIEMKLREEATND